MKVEWHPFDYNDKTTAPPAEEVVWVMDEFYHGVTSGYFDGYTFRITENGSDDCSVTYWAEMSYPDPPEAST